MSEDGQLLPPPPPTTEYPATRTSSLSDSDAAPGEDKDWWNTARDAHDLADQLLKNLQEEADKRHQQEQQQQRREEGRRSPRLQKTTVQVVEILKPEPPIPWEEETDEEEFARPPSQEACGPRAGEYSAYIKSSFEPEESPSPDAEATVEVTKAPTARLCPVGHGLVKHITAEEDWECSICSLTLTAGTAMFGCRECDYDVCGSCMLKADAAALQPRKPKWLGSTRRKIYFRRRHGETMQHSSMRFSGPKGWFRSAAFSRTGEATMRSAYMSAHQQPRTMAASRSMGLFRRSGNAAIWPGKDSMDPSEGVHLQRLAGEHISSKSRERAAAAGRVLEDLEKRGEQSLSPAECSELLARWGRP